MTIVALSIENTFLAKVLEKTSTNVCIKNNLQTTIMNNETRFLIKFTNIETLIHIPTLFKNKL